MLNIGVEEVKGLEEVREAGRILREDRLPHIDYLGFVEGDDIGKGTVDVVVTEGFAGNIALKTAEGTARQFADYLRKRDDAVDLVASIGYLLARPAFRTLRDKMDPRKVNGGVFLGLNGIVIKSHGGTERRASPRRSTSATTWCVTSCSPRSTRPFAGTRATSKPARARGRSRLVTRASFGCARLRQLSAGARRDQ